MADRAPHQATGECLSTTTRELAQRLSGADEVLLLWHPESDRVELSVRNLATGALTQKAKKGGCLSYTLPGCTFSPALDTPGRMAISKLGKSLYVASYTSNAVSVFDLDPYALDVDGDGLVEPLTDGLVVLRYDFGFRGAALITGAIGRDCARCTAEEIEAFIESLSR